MTTLKYALYGQFIWFALASIYNGLSLVSLSHSGVGFAGDQAITVSAMMAALVFFAVTLIGLKNWLLAYRVLAPGVTIMLFLGGVLKHVSAGPVDYASYLAWALAIGINVFGVVVYTLGSAAAFSARLSSTSPQ